MSVIELKIDHPEGEDFCDWLHTQGHDAAVGCSDENYVDDECGSDAEAFLEELWGECCNE